MPNGNEPKGEPMTETNAHLLGITNEAELDDPADPGSQRAVARIAALAAS